MPFVHIRLAGINAAPADYHALQVEVTELMETILRKRGDLTSVLIELGDPHLWCIGAKPVDAAAHIEAFVTAGTNDDGEKDAFIGAAYALLERFCSKRLSVATYVVVQEIPADAWGYGGKTQTARQLG